MGGRSGSNLAGGGKCLYHVDNVLLVALVHELPGQGREGFAGPYSDEMARYPAEGFSVDFVQTVGCGQG